MTLPILQPRSINAYPQDVTFSPPPQWVETALPKAIVTPQYALLSSLPMTQSRVARDDTEEVDSVDDE
jgi:hypothetical protein